MTTLDPVALLADLIAYDTQNPTGDEIAMCRRLAAELEACGADAVELREVPRPRGRSGFVFARFGKPTLLINAHVDTVPANTGWTGEPLSARVEGSRVFGLGACDTKGAIASVLCALAAARPRHLAVLFSGDEELGTRCVPAFLASGLAAGVERAVVCEPTARRAGIRHRGIWARTARAAGRGGHSSRADELPKPIVACARLALDELGARYRDRGPDGMTGLCTSVAAIDGGVAFNVVPDAACLTWSVRPYPGFDAQDYDHELQPALHARGDSFELTTLMDNPPFACRDPDGFSRLLGGAVSGLVSLDFWTEAALFAQAGIDCAVVGPGDIGHAHAPDEHIDRADLEWAVDLYAGMVSR